MERTREFKQWMPAFETMGWPTGMLGNNFRGWAKGRPNTWLNCSDIVRSIQDAGEGKDTICVMVGKEDMMYRPWMWEKQCQEYRDGLRELKTEKKVDDFGASQDVTEKVCRVADVKSEGGVRLVLVEDSGHHVQNDVYCDEAAEALMRWANQV